MCSKCFILEFTSTGCVNDRELVSVIWQLLQTYLTRPEPENKTKTAAQTANKIRIMITLPEFY